MDTVWSFFVTSLHVRDPSETNMAGSSGRTIMIILRTQAQSTHSLWEYYVEFRSSESGN